MHKSPASSSSSGQGVLSTGAIKRNPFIQLLNGHSRAVLATSLTEFPRCNISITVSWRSEFLFRVTWGVSGSFLYQASFTAGFWCYDRHCSVWMMISDVWQLIRLRNPD